MELRTRLCVLPTSLCVTKFWDPIGDLALVGKQILGSVIADRAGHAMHTALVSRLLRDHSLWEETTVEDEVSPVFAERDVTANPTL